MYTILLILALIVIIPLVMALFIDKNYNFSRSITIERPVETVFNYVKYIKNQDHYSKWNRIDPNSRKTYSGHDGSVGFIYAWDSDNKKAGAGEQEIIRINENDRVATELRFERPFRNVAQGYMITEPLSANMTKVSWGLHGINKYPMNLMNLMIRKPLEKDIDEGLANLKIILEQQ